MAGQPRDLSVEELTEITADDALLAADIGNFEREVTQAEALLLGEDSGQPVEIVTSVPGASVQNLDGNNGETILRIGRGDARVEATISDYSGSADRVNLYGADGQPYAVASMDVKRLLKKRTSAGQPAFFARPPVPLPARTLKCDSITQCPYYGVDANAVDTHFRFKHPTEFENRERGRERRHQEAMLATQQANLEIMTRMATAGGGKDLALPVLDGKSVPGPGTKRAVIIEWAATKGLPYGQEEMGLSTENLLIRYGLLEPAGVA